MMARHAENGSVCDGLALKVYGGGKHYWRPIRRRTLGFASSGTPSPRRAKHCGLMSPRSAESAALEAKGESGVCMMAKGAKGLCLRVAFRLWRPSGISRRSGPYIGSTAASTATAAASVMWLRRMGAEEARLDADSTRAGRWNGGRGGPHMPVRTSHSSPAASHCVAAVQMRRLQSAPTQPRSHAHRPSTHRPCALQSSGHASAAHSSALSGHGPSVPPRKAGCRSAMSSMAPVGQSSVSPAMFSCSSPSSVQDMR
mmetsp:Transcript_46084/g.117710  ORF Transcript_46084/g.117710 Transcript_46084/m.117710 type:complete len:256 (+) Transcript_46084:237-1004(+)